VEREWERGKGREGKSDILGNEDVKGMKGRMEGIGDNFGGKRMGRRE
jgi:hypothetical protein